MSDISIHDAFGKLSDRELMVLMLRTIQEHTTDLEAIRSEMSSLKGWRQKVSGGMVVLLAIGDLLFHIGK